MTGLWPTRLFPRFREHTPGLSEPSCSPRVHRGPSKSQAVTPLGKPRTVCYEERLAKVQAKLKAAGETGRTSLAYQHKAGDSQGPGADRTSLRGPPLALPQAKLA